MIRTLRLAVAAAVMIALAGAAAAERRAGREGLAWWMGRVDAALVDAAVTRLPRRTPPVRVAVAWLARPRRLASLDLGAPLLAMVGSDLDGDRRAELYAITEREVIALDVVAGRVSERGRVALPADPPAIEPRDAVATACFEHPGAPELRVRASTGGRGARYAWVGARLTELGSADDFPVCTDKTMALVPGRNHFGSKERPVYDVRCRNDLVDGDGTRLHIVAELGAGGALAVTIEPRCPGCAPVAGGPTARYPVAETISLSAIGTAYAIADLDRDGVVEIVAAGAGAPGDKDAIKVLEATAAAAAKRKQVTVHRTGFSGGVVAIVVVDIDGDGAEEVIGATRLPGSAKVDLWQLNR